MRHAVIALLCCAACGPSSYAAFVAQAQQSFCDHEVKCGVRGVDEPGCALAPATVILPFGGVDVSAAIDAHRLHYDSLKAQSCVHAIHAAPCDATDFTLAVSSPCQVVVTAHAASGAACLDDSECVGGFCVRAAATCFGVCQPYVPATSTCDPSDVHGCDPTVQYCDAAKNVCAVKKNSDSACGDDRECVSGLVCVDGKCQTTPRPHTNAACDAQQVCDNNNYCDDTGVCRARVAIGEVCASADGCKSGGVCAGFSDVEGAAHNGICQAFAALGGACVTDATITGCPATQACANAICVAAMSDAPPLGGWEDACSATQPCVDGFVCTSAECLRPVGVGGLCDASTICAGSLACIDSRCLPTTCTPPPDPN